MNLMASVSRSSGLEKDGDDLKNYNAQEEYRRFIQEKVDNIFENHRRTSFESPKQTISIIPHVFPPRSSPSLPFHLQQAPAPPPPPSTLLQPTASLSLYYTTWWYPTPPKARIFNNSSPYPKPSFLPLLKSRNVDCAYQVSQNEELC
ncbi:hypothetical protein CPB84DRAFT_225698 [Gymnopilus junonius]|uniref:Uncharacterized protein n=1 Tax=Gymnopilus junonius TaxID=109634 RepID=A0A9P5TJ02_GYMJU|nr:hypothetical protein CPB84DRAFT_225698 [Gymnopilus junonius]